MTTIVTRAGKGSPLTNAELDQNFLNLNSAKLEAGDLSPYLLSATAASTYQTIAGMSSYLTTANAASTYQTILVSGTSIKTVNGQSVLGSGNIQIDGGVTSFNTRTGAVTLGSSDVTTALGYTPLSLGGGTMTGNITFAAGQTWPTFNQNTTGSAATLSTGRTIGMTGDVTWTSASFDGSANVTGTATLANSGVTAGTYTKVTVDAKGRVTSGASLASADLPTYTGTLTSSQVTTALGYTPYNSTNPSGYITSGGRAYPRRSDGGDLNFYWSGQSGQPTWLWGGTDGVNMYVYNPSNFSVNYATSAGSASSATNATNASNITSTAGTAGYAVSGQNHSYGGALGPQFMNQGGGGAGFSLHRSGAYAINVALDSDNVFRIGGWSASANRFQMDMSGNLTMAGNVTAYSDERLKKDWADLPADFIEQLAKVKHGTYTRIDSGERQAGVSAQGLLAVLQEAVLRDGQGNLSVAYGNAALTAAVELAARVVALESRLAALEA